MPPNAPISQDTSARHIIPSVAVPEEGPILLRGPDDVEGKDQEYKETESALSRLRGTRRPNRLIQSLQSRKPEHERVQAGDDPDAEPG
jgi:hypothetical protein